MPIEQKSSNIEEDVAPGKAKTQKPKKKAAPAATPKQPAQAKQASLVECNAIARKTAEANKARAARLEGSTK